MKKAIIVFAVCAFVTACIDPGAIKKEILNTPAKQLKNYVYDFGSSLEDRIKPAPDVLLESLRKADKQNNYLPYTLSEHEKKIVGTYLSYVPKEITHLLKERLVGIYFIQGFLGAGMADYVLDENGSLYTILVLNPGVLESSLREWVAYRDNSAFMLESVKITNTLGDAYLGLLYVLLHESSHMYDYCRQVTPYTEQHLQYLGIVPNEKSEIVKGVWRKYDAPVKEYDFPYRNKVVFYGLGEPLPNALIKGIYTDLASTPFASLYGSQSWAEDFAELNTWCYLYKRFGIKYKIEIMEGNTSVFTYSPLDNELIQKRLALIEKITE